MNLKIILTKTLFLTFLLGNIVFCNQAYSQTTYLSSLDLGTSTTANLPILGNYGYSYAQMIYFKSDMNELVQGANSEITKIQFYYSSGSVTQSKDWVIYMGHTTANSFTSTTGWIPLTALVQVYNGDISGLVSGAGWFEITLQTPFPYNGKDNLVLAIDENTPGFSSLAFRQHSGSTDNRSMLYRSDSNNPDPASPPTASARYSYVPQTIFVHEPVGSCSGAPAESAITMTPSTVCQGETSTIRYSQTDLLSGLEYIWQKYDGSSWINIDTTTIPELAVVSQTAATSSYRVSVTCIASQRQYISEAASLDVVASPAMTTNITQLVVCDGETVNLIAGGADTYEWSPATGLDKTDISSVNATITDNTVYSVIGSNEAGCRDTAFVSLQLISKAPPSADIFPLEICTPGNPVTLQLESVAPLNNGGQWQYRFSDENSVVLQDWSTNDTYTFIPAADSVYKLYYRYTSSACPSIVSDSVKKEIIVGFGAKADLTAYNCINQGGSIRLYDYFGQATESIIYQNDLTTASPEITLSGSALYTGNRLVLTPSATSLSGSAVLTIPQFSLSLLNSMTVEFDLTADQMINNYGTGGADGIAYSFGDDVAHVNNTHNGSGSKLRISFDAANNGTNLTGIYLIYGKNNTTAPAPSDATTLAFSPNLSLWKTLENVPVKITILHGTLTLSINGTVVFDKVELPVSYLNEDVSGWQHCFGAQTGGDAMRQAVSNLKITHSELKFGISTDTAPPSVWQNSNVFDDLLPGSYHIWLTKPGTTCTRNIETLVINNENPYVNLGADTIICEGESLTLDAQNPGASYIWSGSDNITNTLVVTAPGSYAVQVTAPNGCTGIDAIQVSMLKAPTAGSINTQITNEHVNFALINVANASLVDWDFGDGHIIRNAATSISHTYTSEGNYTVTATLHNDCDSAEVTTSVDILVSGTNHASTGGLNVYPNPVKDLLTITSESTDPITVSIIDAQGRKIAENISFVSRTAINVADYEAGIYFLNIVTDNKASVLKIVIK